MEFGFKLIQIVFSINAKNHGKSFGTYSEEQRERFHQDIKEMEQHYQDEWNVNMIADFCWMLKRESKVLKIVRSANETCFTDLLMTKGLGKANDREVFVSHEGMDV